MSQTEAVVYEAVARALPTEGRDFLVDIGKGASGGVRVGINPLSPLGAALAPFILAEVGKELDAFIVQPPPPPHVGDAEEL